MTNIKETRFTFDEIARIVSLNKFKYTCAGGVEEMVNVKLLIGALNKLAKEKRDNLTRL